MRIPVAALAALFALFTSACVVINSPTDDQAIAFPHAITGLAVEGEGVVSVTLQIIDEQTGLFWSDESLQWSATPVDLTATLAELNKNKTDWSYSFDAATNPGSGNYRADVVSHSPVATSETESVAFHTNPPPLPRPDRCTAGTFSIDETAAAIVDTDGSWFLPSGANIVGGTHYDDGFYQYHTAWDLYAEGAQALVDNWGVTAMRININSTANPDIFTNSQLDRIINVLSDVGVVSIVTNHNLTGSDPTPAKIAEAVAGFGTMAERHKDNPCVWFSPFNEPGGNPESVYNYTDGLVTGSDAWRQWHIPVIDAIRAHSDTIVVLDETHWGQGRAGGDYTPDQSAVLTYGPSLNETYDNLLYAVHFYARWDASQTDMTAYLDQAHGDGLAIVIGEVGGHPTNGDFLTLLRWDTAQAVYGMRAPGVGIMAWHGKTTSISGSAMGPGTSPYALTAMWDLATRADTEAIGTLHWDWANNPPLPAPATTTGGN